MLAKQILDHGGSFGKQLKGIAIGDGCTSGLGCSPLFKGPYFSVEFFRGHGQISGKTYKEIKTVCPEDELRNGVKSAKCKKALDKMDEEKGYNFAYNLYDECYDFALSVPQRKWHEPLTYGPPTVRQRQLPSVGSSEDEDAAGLPK